MSCQKDTSMRNTAIRSSHPLQPPNKIIVALLTRVLIAANFADRVFAEATDRMRSFVFSQLTCEPGTILNNISQVSVKRQGLFFVFPCFFSTFFFIKKNSVKKKLYADSGIAFH